MPLSKFIASASITLQSIENVAIYQSEIISSNGNLFKPYDTMTNLSLSVYQDFKNITDQFTDIEWRKYTFDSNNVIEDKNWGVPHTGKKYLQIDKSEIDGKCLIQADVYTEKKGLRTCVASARITLIDVNELYNGSAPPGNPLEGTLWVDTSSSPFIIYSWNSSLNKWESVGTTTPFVRNLIRNSDFWMLNDTYFNIENDEGLLDAKVVNTFEKNWLRLKSSSVTTESMITGISQITNYPVLKKSDYTFSFLAYRLNDVEFKGQSAYIKVLSIDSSNRATDLISTLKVIDKDNMTQLSVTFKTLNDTERLRVVIGVEPNKMCDFYVTELSLYNTNSFYPWELAPEDVQDQLSNKLEDDHDAVFNALTRNRTMEGIYVMEDNMGAEHFYFNATHIKTGTLDGGLINGIGLHIKDDATGESVFHVYKDAKGTHIDMTANNLYIGPAKDAASTIKYVDSNRTESELLLNGNIATAKTEAIQSSNSYTDDKIIETITQNEDYTNGQIGTSQDYLITYINNKANTAEDNANNYTDEQIAGINTSNNNNTANLRKEITKAKQDANDYTDDKVSDAKKDMTNYIDNKTNAINNTLNDKANSSTVSTLSTKVDTIDKRTTTTMMVSTVTSSNTYTSDLAKKVNVTDFNDYKKEVDNKFNSMSGGPGTSETLDLVTIFTNQGITNSGNTSADGLTVDNIVDSITFYKIGTNLSMNVAKISETNYVKKTGSNTYIDNNEMIKLLLYEIQLLKQEINDLKNNQ